MKIQYHLRGLNPRIMADRPMDSYLERLSLLIPISEAQVILEYQNGAAPAYTVSVDLAVPGPDIHAAACDHTLEAALGKVSRDLEGRIHSRQNNHELRRTPREHFRAVSSKGSR